MKLLGSAGSLLIQTQTAHWITLGMNNFQGVEGQNSERQTPATTLQSVGINTEQT